MHNDTNQLCCRIILAVCCRVAEPEPESEVFGWSRIPNNTGSPSRIFCPTPTPDVQLIICQITLLDWEFLLKWFLLKLFLKQRFLAVHHDFHRF